MHIVYKITNLINERIYVGVHKVSDIQVDDGYMGSGKAIRLAIKKYGLENFKKEILVSFEDAEAAYLAESIVVDEEFIARSDTYNIVLGGGNGTGSGRNNPRYGTHHSEKTKDKMSAAQLGEKNHRYGKQNSTETRKKLSDALSGRVLSEEHRQKISDANKGKKCGRQLSEEHRQKISDAMTGRVLTEETKNRMSISKKGKNNPNFGKNDSDETKKKKSNAQKERNRKPQITI